MKKAVLISFFQSSNLGDIILSKKLYDEINLKRDVIRIDFVSGKEIKITKDIIKFSNNNRATNNSFKEKLKKVRFIMELIDVKNTFKCLRAVNWEKVNRVIECCDDVIIGGGNMIMGLSYDFIFLFYKYILIAKKYNKNINVVCVGVGPFKNRIQKKVIKKALSGINNIFARDLISKEILDEIIGDIKVRVSGDPALLCDNFCTKENKEYIAISVYPHQKDKNKSLYYKYLSELADLIQKINDEFDKDIVLFSTEINDYEAVYDLYSQVKSKTKIELKIVEIKSFDDLILLYNRTEILIGTRLHSIIIAYSQSIPIIGLAWQGKVWGFFDYIDKESNVFDINDISGNMDMIIAVCRNIFNNYEEECKGIYTNKKKLKAKFYNSLMCLDGE